MIGAYLQQLLVLIKRLLICYGIYFLCRIVFYFSNISYFQGTGVLDLILDCFYGLRVDSFSIVVINSLFILLSILPFNFFWNSGYQKMLKWIFFITNPVFIGVNCIDIGYFPFIRKRSSADILKQMGGQSDLSKLIPQFLIDFWWIVLFFITLIVLLVVLYKRVNLTSDKKYSYKGLKQIVLAVFLFVFTTALAVLGVRGGLQRVPITIVDAGSVTSAEEVPIVLNTPFTIIKSMEEKTIEEFDFFPPAKLRSLYDPLHQYKDSVLKKQNVVVIILESFAKEYTKLGRKSMTPFLDSLMDQSLTCTNAFSNGTKSIEGIPAILSGLPSLMEDPFINSGYAFNDQTSFAMLLGAEGYQTSFFHGGINGTMNFDSWAALAGYQNYFGKNEYNNNEDFDGFWGIWDEPFLQYTVKKMNTFKQPFHSAIFTLSSHHPYKIPEKYKGKFPKGDLENSESIAYADYALRQFFAAAKKTKWYNNTLFVLTADHGSLSEHPFYSNVVGNQSVPVLFFRPDNSLKAIYPRVFSQMDILPSTLQLLGYNKPFFSYGESFADKKYNKAYLYASSTHFVYTDSMLFCINLPKLSQTYNYRRDSILTHQLLSQYPQLDSNAFTHFKAFIQTYNRSLIHNKGRVK